MKYLYKNRFILIALNFILAAIFIIAGLSKLFDPAKFSYYLKYVYNFPGPFPIIVATIFPVIEIILGLFILFQIQHSLSVLISRVILIIFIGIHFYKWLILKNITNCHCYGEFINLDENIVLIINILLIIITFIISKKDNKTNFNQLKYELKNYFKTKVVVRTLTILLFFIIISLWIYFRMVRIDNELSSGLISTIDNDISKIRTIEILEKNVRLNTRQKNTLFVFLRSPGCATCLEEILFWNTHSSKYDFNIVIIYPSSPEGNESSIKKLFNITFPFFRLKDNYYSEILGKYASIYTRMLITINSNIYTDKSINAGNEVERRNSFLNLIKDFEK
jgi:uncharacterized membrane protein YphA (DoxX/SURF4 family)